MKRSRAHFHVVGLQQSAAFAAPVTLQLENQFLEGEHERAVTAKDSTGFPRPDPSYGGG